MGHFLRTSSTSPLYSSVYLYNQMIAIQRTSASLGATTGARSSNATSRKNHRAAAASTVTRRNGMRSHSVTSMERRTKNSFRLPAIAMPSPEVNEQMMQTMTYNETGKWRENFDLAGWAKEIREVEKEQRSDKYHEEDVKHLKKILGWANMCYYGGLGVMFLLPQLGVAQAFGANVLGAFMMSTAICARWTMVGHHVCHGGYNAAMTEGNEIKGRFHRRKFARGPWNRIIDWMDWMMPEAWDVEHNHLHHYQLGEDADPDLVERNMKTTREGPMPMWARYMQVAALSVIWKWFYYAPNTMKELFARRAREAEKRGKESYQPYTTGSMPSTVLTTVQSAFQGNFGAIIETAKCFAPYATFQFGVLPAVGYAIGGAQMAMATLVTTFTDLNPRQNRERTTFTCEQLSALRTFAPGATSTISCTAGRTTKSSTTCGRTCPCDAIKERNRKLRRFAKSTACRTCKRTCSSALGNWSMSWSASAQCSCGKTEINF